ncbi:MAG: hypothetical protein HC905_11295 [Bacteroidales bacterium]|nr:hypothetical protein [Bacteroidales bacterium]
MLHLPAGNYSINWYNPLTGGNLIPTKQLKVKDPGQVSIGLPPIQNGDDWLALVAKAKNKP